MSRNYDEMIDECTGSAYTEETLTLGNGAHVIAHKKARENRERRMKFGQLQTDINLELPEGIKKYNGWFPVVVDESFNIVKDPNGIIALNSKIPQITSEEVEGLIFLTRNMMIKSGIDKYGGRTKTEVPYSEIIDSMTKDRTLNICYKANKLGL